MHIIYVINNRFIRIYIFISNSIQRSTSAFSSKSARTKIYIHVEPRLHVFKIVWKELPSTQSELKDFIQELVTQIVRATVFPHLLGITFM